MIAKLEERKARILRVVVRDYIRTAEPVGSGRIVQRYRLDVSPATVRHEMSVLEDLGYLVQPHTSAGRIPTDRGYRYFVDSLPPRLPLPATLREGIFDFFGGPLGDVDAALDGATQLLSRLTGHAAIAIPPMPAGEVIQHAELIVVGSSVLFLVVSDTGRVHKRVLDLPDEPAAPAVEAVSARLGALLAGSSYVAARQATDALTAKAAEDDRPLIAAVTEALSELEGEPEPVFLGGVANIAGADAFEHRETLRRLVEALEERATVARLLRSGESIPGPLRVQIGHENPLSALSMASVVLARYGIGDRIVGTIAVIGPTRMEYPAVMSTAHAVAGRLSDIVGQLSA